MSQNKPQWRVLLPREGKMGGVDIYEGDQYVCQMSHHPAERQMAKDYAARIVACVNACEGVPTELLETSTGALGALTYQQNLRKRAESQRTELLAALTDALAWIDAVPSDMPLPAMPGFDRDEVNNLIAAVKGAM